MTNPERQSNNLENQQEAPREDPTLIAESENYRTVLDCINQKKADQESVLKIGDREISREDYQGALRVVSNLNSEKEKLLTEQAEAKKEDRFNIQREIDKIDAEIEEKKKIIEEFEEWETTERKKEQERDEKEEQVCQDLLAEIANPEQIDQQIDQITKQREELDQTELPITAEAEELNRLIKEKEDLEELARTSDRTEAVRIKKEITAIEPSIDQLTTQAEKAKQEQAETRRKELEEIDAQLEALDDEKKVVARLVQEMNKTENETLKKAIEIRTGKRKSPEQEKKDEMKERYQELSERLKTQKKFIEGKNFPEIFKQLIIEKEKQQQIIKDAEKWIVHKQKLIEEKRNLLPKLEKKFLGIDFNKKKREKILADIKELEETSLEFENKKNKALEEIEKNNQEETRAKELRNTLVDEMIEIEQEQINLLDELGDI